MAENNGCDTKQNIGRAIRAKIGRELRTLYQDLVRERLPENLLARVRALDEVLSSRQRVKEAFKKMRGVRPADDPSIIALQTAKRA
jgi:flagellin-specific chaperone FliS